MIATVQFTLLLVGAMMVSQVFSRPVLLVVIDSINASFVSARMPRLDKGGDQGALIARPGLLKSENPTKPFSLLHTLATGVLPDVHGVVNNRMFDENGNKIFNKEAQFTIDKDLKPLWTEAVLSGIKTATYKWPGSNFLMYNKLPDISEIYNTLMDWDTHVSTIKKWFAEDNVQFGMAFFEDIDWKISVNKYIDKAYNAILKLYEELNDIDLDIIIISTHGRKIIHLNNILNMADFVSTKSCNCKIIAAAGVSFIRFNSEEDLNEMYKTLKERRDHGIKFNVYKKNEETMKEWNLKDCPNLTNTLIVAAINGYTFYDQNAYDNAHVGNVTAVRENGYPKSDADMNGMLLLKGNSFKNNVVAQDAEIQLTEVYQLTKKLLGLNQRASDKQKVEDLSDNMKQLIEDETLREWEKIGIK